MKSLSTVPKKVAWGSSFNCFSSFKNQTNPGVLVFNSLDLTKEVKDLDFQSIIDFTIGENSYAVAFPPSLKLIFADGTTTSSKTGTLSKYESSRPHQSFMA